MANIDIQSLNAKSIENPVAFIGESENNYHKHIEDIARRVAENDNLRIILLAGPSGSGKTTTANILADRIRCTGLESLVISLDNFYRDANDSAYPTLPSGERDFEAIEALNLADIEKTLGAILNSLDFEVPRYDFKVGGRVEVQKYSKILHGCVIIEGLHALNPKIFEHLPQEKILRVFISVSTNITDSGERILSGRKIRFVRRMVRDSIYRAADASRTLNMWENVLLGEDKYLYPFRSNADIDFDTFHPFELGVMKPYVMRLISEELAEENEYAGIIHSAISKVAPINEDYVPDDSLIREFITGGKYEEFY